MTSDMTALQLLLAGGRALLVIVRLSPLGNLSVALCSPNANDSSA